MRDMATLFEILFGANIKWTSTRRRAGWILARSKRAGPYYRLSDPYCGHSDPYHGLFDFYAVAPTAQVTATAT